MLLHAFIILDRCFLSRDWSRTSGTRVRTLSEPCWEHGTGSGPSSSVPSRNRSSPLSVIPARNLSADERLTHFIGIFPYTWRYGGIFWPSYAHFVHDEISRFRFRSDLSSSRVPTRAHFRTRDQSLFLSTPSGTKVFREFTVMPEIRSFFGISGSLMP